MRLSVHPDLSSFDPEAWNALVGEDDPFVEHAFLRALERSGSVGGRSGWQPMHVAAWEGERLVGALPLYLKEHSYGEYIFDWGWAEASLRAGVPYYPKLVGMVPFTPATGRRLLHADDVNREAVRSALLQQVRTLAADVGASSAHLLFLNEDEHRFVQRQLGWMSRLSWQFHWSNRGYTSFDAFLASFRSKLRKQVRRERARAVQAGLDVRVREGSELSDRDWNALSRFYVDTCERKGSMPYLRPAFFDELRRTHAERVVAVMAYRGDEPIAGTLNFQKGKRLYGRYWGCAEDHEALHFELCYYRLIERAIVQDLERFEAGAQGAHKLRRGLMPSEVHSAHWIADSALATAVRDFLPREAAAVRRQMHELAHHGPFKRSD